MSAYFGLAYPYFIFSLFIGSFLPFLSLYLNEQHLNPWQIGVVTSLFFAPKIISPYILSWFADKYNCISNTIRISYIASLFCLIPLLFHLQFWFLCLVMIAMSFFWSAITPLLDALAISFLGNKQGNYGRIRLWASVSYLIAVTATGYFVELYGVNQLIYLFLIIKIIGLTSLPFIKNPNPIKPIANPIADKLSNIDNVLRKTEVRLFFLAAFLMALGHCTYGSFYSLYLTSYEYKSHTIGWLFAVGVLAEVLVFIGMPILMRIFTIKQILLFSFACAIVRYTLIGTFVTYLPILIFAQLLHGGSFAAFHASSIHLVSKIFNKADKGKGQAIYTILTFGFGGVFANLIAGDLWQAYGGKAVFLAQSCLISIGLIILCYSFDSKGCIEKYK